MGILRSNDILQWSWTTRPGWAQIPNLPAPHRAEASVEGPPSPALVSSRDEAQNLTQLCCFPLPITECHIPERVSTSGASAGTFGTPGLPGNYGRAGKGEFLWAAQQPTAPHDSHKTPQGTAMPEGPGGSSGTVTHLPASDACCAF